MTRPFNASGRAAVLDRLAATDYDVAIVGGGINGAGIARDAAMRGLRVALFERGDFACGTSSASSKLLHGGVRYLEQLEFHLVWEALGERATMCQLAPHLAQPVPFLFPLYADAPVGPFKLDLGLWLYDVLAGWRNLGLHRRLSAAQMRAQEPRLRGEGLRGGCSYYDAVTDDARLTLENARSAWEHGADTLPYVEAEALVVEGGRSRGLRVRTIDDNRAVEVRARCVVNACGPWSDRFRASAGLRRPLIRPTKGVHVLVPRALFPAEHAVVMTSADDHRILFVIPWGTLTILGTTDTDCDPGGGAPQADRSDVDYILGMVEEYFPGLGVTVEHVLSTYAGLRPLVAHEGAPSAVSREHWLAEELPGLLTIAGGKLTTYRLMARDVVDHAVDVLRRDGGTPAGRSTTAREPLVTRRPDGLEPPSGLDVKTYEHLRSVYGPRSVGVGAVARRLGASGAARLTAHAEDVLAQVVYAFESEMALYLDDALARRTHALYAGMTRAEAATAATALGWKKVRQKSELARLDTSLHRMHAALAQPRSPAPDPRS